MASSPEPPATVPPSSSTASTPSQRGLLILLEGLDKSGKSTQCALLQKHLESIGQKAVIQRFPDRTTPIGDLINAYLLNQLSLPSPAIHLLFTSNRWELASTISSTLASGTHVILDRYVPSNLVFTLAKENSASNIELGSTKDVLGEKASTAARIVQLATPELGLPLPDLTFHLHLDPQTAAKRGAGFGAERYETIDYQTWAHYLWGYVAGWWDSWGGCWITVEASRTPEEVQEEIVARVRLALQEERGELGKVGRELGKGGRQPEKVGGKPGKVGAKSRQA